ncbi:MAG: DNA polymerase I [Bacteroidota bacterium]
MLQEKRLFLLDAYALIYRAYYAFNKNPRINSKGINTSAILGFANTLFEILQNEKPTHIAVVFDVGEATQRTVDFTDYKANRESTPEDIVIAVPYIIQLIEAFNIPVLGVPGYEADDVIGTLAKKAEEHDFKTFMMTPDKDFGQLVSDKTFIYKPAQFGNKSEILGVAEVCKKFEIQNTLQVIDILGLMGDKVDNIPGIPGVGEKTAMKLIQDFGSLEAVLANADKLKGKLQENVIKFADQAILSKKLATIILDAPIDFDEESLRTEQPNRPVLKSLLEELEFRQFSKRVLGEAEIVSSPSQPNLFDQTEAAEEKVAENFNTYDTIKPDYKLIETKEERNKLISKIKELNHFCFDTETTGLDPHNAEIVGLSISFNKSIAYYIYFPNNYNESVSLLAEFKEVFEDENIGKTGQNIKYDMAILSWYDIKVKGTLFDTMIAHYLIEPDMRHNMDYLAETYLNYRPISIESLIGKKGKDQISMRFVPIDIQTKYAAEDADVTLQLRSVFEPELKKNKLDFLFSEVEMPLVKVLCAMEAEGIRIDSNALAEFSIYLHDEIEKEEKAIIDLAGVKFNIASPKQLGDVLFEVLALDDKAKKTKTKQYSTGEDVLMKYLGKHPIIQHILDYRSLAKLKSTYVDSLPLLVNPRTGRIHTSYNQTVAATGRLSSNNPNLQNIPIRTERGREIRKAFVPRNANYTLISADYSQIELRIIAHLSGDVNMIADFNSGLDIHTATAAKVFKVEVDKVDKEMRRKAKSVNFGIIYGISAFGLSQQLSISRKEAADIIEEYFKQYSGIKKYMESTIEFARANGYVETILKRRRHLRDINSGNAIVRGFAERNAINAPIQGSAADMIKVAMIQIFDAMEEKQLRSKMILQVHDELVFDVHLEEIDIVKKIISEIMKSAMVLSVPVEVDINCGNNWLEAH